MSDYRWSTNGEKWRIGYGPSNFLIAEGSGFSIALGQRILEFIEAEHPTVETWHKHDETLA